MAAAFVLSGCASGGGTVAETPDPSKNYRIELIRHVPRTLERLLEQGLGSLDVEEPELLASTEPHVVSWRRQVLALRGRPELETITEVNLAANERVRYISDYEHWQVRERWGFPIEALEEGGDCEDIALLKMESLHLLGFDMERMHLLVGTSDLSGRTEGHAVLMVTLADKAQLILDSATPWIHPPSDEHHFFPIYAVQRDHYYKVAIKR